ncbi:MAG: hypothetical protein GIKADHBN_00871 [Phycisphaerales bacterium]|nr:hypothetical protein [Phycisphaerales bacterium]
MFDRPWPSVIMIAAAAAAAISARALGPQPGDARPADAASVPQPVQRVDFDRDIRPILVDNCVKCHTERKHRGGLRLDDREQILLGGDSGPAVVVGDPDTSLLIELVSGKDPDRVMPDKGDPLTDQQIALLRNWIAQGLAWGEGPVTPKGQAPARVYALELRKVELPATDDPGNPIDRLIARSVDLSTRPTVDDRAFARRVHLDLIGLLPSPQELREFLADIGPDRHGRLVDRLLGDRRRYAEHWLTFWNDCLRNDYQGTGYIDGGREQITQWLFTALYNNMPYDRFVSDLVNPPTKDSAGFSKGIVWRGVVNASQVPPMQAAQNVSQVFLGLNLKCASCHDSFINEWKLSDAYSLAAAFAHDPLEVSRCDRPLGTMAKPGFLYPQLGTIDPGADRPERLRRLAALLTARENGRFTRTIVNRLWAQLFGRGIIEPVDEMDNPPWSSDLLDFLAADFIEHGYDIRHTLELIATSRAYRLVAAPGGESFTSDAPFAGPVVRRMTAEQFVDAVRTLAGVWPEKADATITVPGTTGAYPGPVRAALQAADPLMLALGRPNRDQVVTSRPSAATTLQAIELTNGSSLNHLLQQAGDRWAAGEPSPESVVDELFVMGVSRRPSPAERAAALELVGSPVTSAGVQDLLWSLAMLPEFQLIQ